MIRFALKFATLTACGLCIGTGAFGQVLTNIPDNSATGVTVTSSPSSPGTITDVNLVVNVVHPCVQDLEITITAPGGSPVPLLIPSPNGGVIPDTGCRANFTGTVLDDQAGQSLANGVAPFAGSFNPSHSSVGNNPLARLIGGPIAGQWTVKIADRRAGNVGQLAGFTLVLNSATGLRFVPVTPCRLVDTREVSLGAFGAPVMAGGSTRSFVLPQQSTCGLPANAAAYSLNVTVVPQEPLGYLTTFPTGSPQPFVSTLNSIDGRIKANAAIIPAGTGGAISVYANNATHLVLDVNGYFVDPTLNAQSLAFYPISPCRVADTRSANGPLGGPIIPLNSSRNFPVLSSNCGVPASAQAYSLSATVVPPGALGYLTLWPTDRPQPFVSTLNALTGAIVANAAIVPAGTNGSVSAFVSATSHLVLDINGYFAPPGAANAQRFFTANPCRLLDTREAAGEFGGPILGAGSTRSYRLPLANCGLPSTAAAFSLNATVVPTTTLGFLTLFPAGTAQPLASTLNATDDAIVANAAIVAAGTAGGVSSFVNNQTHLILDTNGYFAP